MNLIYPINNPSNFGTYTGSPRSMSLFNPQCPNVRGKYAILMVKLKTVLSLFFNEFIAYL